MVRVIRIFDCGRRGVIRVVAAVENRIMVTHYLDCQGCEGVHRANNPHEISPFNNSNKLIMIIVNLSFIVIFKCKLL